MLCPRCRHEVAEASYLCPGCGTPLRLPDEPPPPVLDASLSIDRRQGGERTWSDNEAWGGVTAPLELPRRQRGGKDVARSQPASSGAGAHGPGPSLRVTASVGRASAEPDILPATSMQPRAHADAGRQPRGAQVSAGGAEETNMDIDGNGFLQPDHDVPQTVSREVHVTRPETWRRPAAWAVDALPFAVGAVMLARRFVRRAEPLASTQSVDGFLDLVGREWVIVVSVTVAAVLALGVYATLAHALAGATLGKKIFGLRLVCQDGARPTMGRSAARSGLCFASAAIFGMGFLLALFTRSGRSLHDFLARTWVVRAS